MTRIKKATQDRMKLRQRLDWLLVAIHAGRYPVHSGAGELAAAYSAATGMPCIMHGGLMRSRQLTNDLGELHERGYLARETVTLRQGGRMAVVLKFELTAKGCREVSAVIARTTEKAA